MKSLIAFVLLAVLAGSIDGQTPSRPTRAVVTRPGAPTTRKLPVRPGATTRGAPVRQTGGVVSTSRPGPVTRSVVTTARTVPTTATTTRNGGPVTVSRPINSSPTAHQPDHSIPIWPNDSTVPTVPTGRPVTNPGGRVTTRSPRVGLTGIPNSRCPAVQDARNPVHLTHQSNCERFFKCDHGLAYEYQCPVGQHWNAMKNYCDFPNLANCGGSNWNWNNNPNNIPNNNWNNVPNNNWNNVPNNNWNNVPNNNWNNSPNNIPNRDRAPQFQNPIVIPMAPGK